MAAQASVYVDSDAGETRQRTQFRQSGGSVVSTLPPETLRQAQLTEDTTVSLAVEDSTIELDATADADPVRRIRREGGSLVLSVPTAVLSEAGMSEGDTVWLAVPFGETGRIEVRDVEVPG